METTSNYELSKDWLRYSSKIYLLMVKKDWERLEETTKKLYELWKELEPYIPSNVAFGAKDALEQHFHGIFAAIHTKDYRALRQHVVNLKYLSRELVGELLKSSPLILKR